MKHRPALDTDFVPAVLWNRSYAAKAAETPGSKPLAISLERGDSTVSVYRTTVLPHTAENRSLNIRHVERLLKFLLWQRGGYRVLIAGEPEIATEIRGIYSPGGARAFDHDCLGRKVYGHPMEVEACEWEDLPEPRERSIPLGRNLDGCRIGFDLGGSDRKCAALLDGKVVFSEEVRWDPYFQSDPQYHYDGIRETLRRAAEHLPRVDAIGGSAAGVYVNNEVRAASLFRGVSEDDFEKRVRRMFFDLQKEWGGIPFEVVNDGEVTALAGSMSMNDNAVLGISLGTSLAAGYVDPDGHIRPWLNELAFAPVDYRENAPADEWSGDAGCGVQYFSQQGVARLIPLAGIALPAEMPFAEQLVEVQKLMAAGDARARAIYETIGTCFGYAVAHYADFYEIRNLLILGRVTSGEGGEVILENASAVLRDEFPELADHLKFSGDTAFASAMLPVVNRMLEIQIKTMSGGLLPCPRGEKYWHFYEWTPHLSGLKSLQRHREVLTGVRYDAMLNAIFCMALEAGAGLNTHCQQPDVAGKYRDIASGLRGAFRDKFWRRDAAAFVNSVGQDVQPTFSGLTQAMAICAHLCPDGMQASLISRLASNDPALSPVSLSQTLYKYEAILSLRDAHSKGVFEEIAMIWGEMLFRGATTFWETSNGPTELMGVGSLCHGWSAIPIYFFQAWLLGIKPLEPGFKVFSVEPLHGVVHSVSGTVPTPHGPIHLSWSLVGTSADLEITVPPGTVATLPDGRMLDAGFHRVSLPAPSACNS